MEMWKRGDPRWLQIGNKKISVRVREVRVLGRFLKSSKRVMQGISKTSLGLKGMSNLLLDIHCVGCWRRKYFGFLLNDQSWGRGFFIVILDVYGELNLQGICRNSGEQVGDVDSKEQRGYHNVQRRKDKFHGKSCFTSIPDLMTLFPSSDAKPCALLPCVCALLQ